jgi:uncharacterized protein
VLIRAYQMTLSRLIVAVMGPVCRFEPSCSRYAAACIAGHGALRGSLLSLKRLCRCHPFHPGGFDPPPPPPLRRGEAGRASTQQGAVASASSDSRRLLVDPAEPIGYVDYIDYIGYVGYAGFDALFAECHGARLAFPVRGI